jgi:hypothetical protein
MNLSVPPVRGRRFGSDGCGFESRRGRLAVAGIDLRYAIYGAFSTSQQNT